MVMIVEVITSFLQLRLDVREPALVAGFGISGCWVGGLLRKSPQAARRRQPVTRHRVAGSREITGMAMADNVIAALSPI